MEWGYTRKGDTYKVGIHTRREHTWRWDTHGKRIYTEKGHK